MSKRILVVDDQEDLRGVLRDLLTGSGYTVIEEGGRDGKAEGLRSFEVHNQLVFGILVEGDYHRVWHRQGSGQSARRLGGRTPRRQTRRP